MKKLLTLTAIGAIIATPATAVQKCVAFDASTTECTSESAYGNADWSATCTTNGTSVPIKGIAMCSNQEADDYYATSDAITMVRSETETTNVYCWCKMVEPAVSSWVFLEAHASADYCADYCSFYCADVAGVDAAYRAALFGSLAN